MHSKPEVSETWKAQFDAVLSMVMEGEFRGMLIPCPGLSAYRIEQWKREHPGMCPFAFSDRTDLDWEYFPYSRRGPVLAIYPAGSITKQEAFQYCEAFSVN